MDKAIKSKTVTASASQQAKQNVSATKIKKSSIQKKDVASIKKANKDIAVKNKANKSFATASFIKNNGKRNTRDADSKLIPNKYTYKKVDNGNPKFKEMLKIKSRTQLPSNKGKWSGAKGNSNWVPNENAKPTQYNEKHLTWGKVLAKNGINAQKGIPFKNGKPEFSAVNKSWEKTAVNIDKFTTKRNRNFAKADRAYANKFGINCADVTKMRKNNKLTWHEDGGNKMMLIPSEIHANIPHAGGIAEKRTEIKHTAESMSKIYSKER